MKKNNRVIFGKVPIVTIPRLFLFYSEEILKLIVWQP